MQEYNVKVYNCRTDWYQNGKLHRLDGPAVEWTDGTEHWRQNGKLHRTDGPAVVYADGTKYWHQNGKQHRIDGPAVEYLDGSVEYWVNGNKIPNPQKAKEMTVKQICEALGHNVKIVK